MSHNVDDLAVYRKALDELRADLAHAEERKRHAVVMMETAQCDRVKFARVVLALSRQLGIEPDVAAVAVLNEKQVKRLARQG